MADEPRKGGGGAVGSLERERRIRRVREAVVTEGWSDSIEYHLASELGCSRRTVRRYRQIVEERIKARADWHDEQDDRTARSTLLDELREIRREARKAGKFAAAVSSVALEARLRSLDPGVEIKHSGEVKHSGEIVHRAQRDVSALPRDVLLALAEGASADQVAALVDTGGHVLQPTVIEVEAEPVATDEGAA